MTYVLRFLPEVEDDALSGYAWYEGKAQGLGHEFLRTFYVCANEVLRNPLISPKVHREFRRRLLRRFPYAVYFRMEDNETKETRTKGYESVLELISGSISKKTTKMERTDREFEALINAVRLWSPARCRNSEGEYKIELRKHLESLRFPLNEEFGESNFDLLVNKKCAIEIKKDPNFK